MLNSKTTGQLIGLQAVTLGLYFFYWSSVCRRELNTALNSKFVPSTWFLVLPGLNYWWMWQYSKALAGVTGHKIKDSETFLLYLIASSSILFLGSGFSNIFGTPTNVNVDVSPNDATILLIMLLSLAAFYVLALIIGHTFFIAIMQKRTDTAKLQP